MSSCPNGEHSATVQVDLRIVGAEDGVESGAGQRGPTTSSRSLGGGSRRSLEVGDPPGGPTTSNRSLGACRPGFPAPGGPAAASRPAGDWPGRHCARQSLKFLRDSSSASAARCLPSTPCAHLDCSSCQLMSVRLPASARCLPSPPSAQLLSSSCSLMSVRLPSA